MPPDFVAPPHPDCPAPHLSELISARLDEIADRLTGIEVLQASTARTVDILVSAESSNRHMLVGNGGPGIKSEVAVLKDQVAELRDGHKWLWRAAVVGLVLPIVVAIVVALAVRPLERHQAVQSAPPGRTSTGAP